MDEKYSTAGRKNTAVGQCLVGDMEGWEETTEDDLQLSIAAILSNDVAIAPSPRPPLVLWHVHFLAVLQRKCSLTKTTLVLLLKFMFSSLSFSPFLAE